MVQKKMPLKPLPDGITLPEVPEGWEWCSSTEQDIVLYMPGGDGEQIPAVGVAADVPPLGDLGPIPARTLAWFNRGGSLEFAHGRPR